MSKQHEKELYNNQSSILVVRNQTLFWQVLYIRTSQTSNYKCFWLILPFFIQSSKKKI